MFWFGFFARVCSCRTERTPKDLWLGILKPAIQAPTPTVQRVQDPLSSLCFWKKPGPTLARSLAHPLTHSPTHSLTHSLTQALSLTLSLSFFLSLSLFLSLSPSLSLPFLPYSPCLPSLSPSFSLSLSVCPLSLSQLVAAPTSAALRSASSAARFSARCRSSSARSAFRRSCEWGDKTELLLGFFRWYNCWQLFFKLLFHHNPLKFLSPGRTNKAVRMRNLRKNLQVARLSELDISRYSSYGECNHKSVWVRHSWSVFFWCYWSTKAIKRQDNKHPAPSNTNKRACILGKSYWLVNCFKLKAVKNHRSVFSDIGFHAAQFWPLTWNNYS